MLLEDGIHGSEFSLTALLLLMIHLVSNLFLLLVSPILLLLFGLIIVLLGKLLGCFLLLVGDSVRHLGHVDVLTTGNTMVPNIGLLLTGHSHLLLLGLLILTI